MKRLRAPGPGPAQPAQRNVQWAAARSRSTITSRASNEPFRLTPSGREAFAPWLAEFISTGPRDEQLHSPLVLMVFFGDFIAPAELRQSLFEHRRQHALRLEALVAMQCVLGPSRRPPAQTVARAIVYHQFTMDWITGSITALSSCALSATMWTVITVSSPHFCARQGSTFRMVRRA